MSDHLLFHARSRARRLAIQAVYQWQMTGQDFDEISAQFAAEDDYDKADAGYFAELLRAAITGAADGELQQCMDMPLESVDPIERAIVRNAAYEILCRDDIDSAVAITEAVRLAKKYGADQGYRFVNGVLDRLAKRCSGGAVGEEQLVRAHLVREVGDDAVVVGIGDDAAVLGPVLGQLVVTADTLVAGTHFNADADAGDIGHKALAVNLSDIAAMGAAPRWALLALTLPRADEDWVSRFAAGFFALADSCKVSLVGGDTARGPLSATVQLMGTASGGCMTRTGARDGDGIYLTGAVGDAGLAARRAERLNRCGAGAAKACRRKAARPSPRIVEGQLIAQHASAAIDVSDGVFMDLSRLLDAGGVGGEVGMERIPVSRTFRDCCDTAADWLSALTYGDDYELLFTMDDAHLDELQQSLTEAAACGVTRIGRITAQTGLRCTFRDDAMELPRSPGHDHFR